MTFTTLQQALDALENVNANQADIIAFVRQLSVNCEGTPTVLYSGDISGKRSWKIVEAMGDDIRHIGKTIASEVLDSDEFKVKVAQTFHPDDGIVDVTGFNALDETDPAKLWLSKGGTGPWATVSEMFVEATTGPVKVLTLGPEDNSVFFQNELPKLLDNKWGQSKVF